MSQIPEGKVSTYGTLARELKVPKASRAIGSILRANPHPIVVPCHRVVMSDGQLGGYGGSKGGPRKAALLRREGVKITRGGRIDLERYLFKSVRPRASVPQGPTSNANFARAFTA